MFPDASEKNIILGFPQNDYHKYLPGMSRSWWRSLMGHSQQCSTGIHHQTFGNDQKHFFWTLPPFPPLPIECPFSVRKLKSPDQSRLRLRWKLKNSSLEKKVFLRPLCKGWSRRNFHTNPKLKPANKRRWASQKWPDLPIHSTSQVLFFFREHLLQSLYLCYTCRSLKVEANTNGWTHNQYLPEGWLCHKTQDNNIRSVSFHW